jgi:hypothetical protein
MMTTEYLDVKDLSAHPALDSYPRASEAAFHAVRASIEAAGQRDPVTVVELPDGSRLIADGRIRLAACIDLEIEPRVEVVQVSDELEAIDLITARNAARRHLSKSQLALIAAETIGPYEQAAAERRRAGGQAPAQGKAAEALAIAFMVSSRMIEMALRVIRSGCRPLVELVRNGLVRLGKAELLVKTYRDESLFAIASRGPEAIAAALPSTHSRALRLSSGARSSLASVAVRMGQELDLDMDETDLAGAVFELMATDDATFAFVLSRICGTSGKKFPEVDGADQAARSDARRTDGTSAQKCAKVSDGLPDSEVGSETVAEVVSLARARTPAKKEKRKNKEKTRTCARSGPPGADVMAVWDAYQEAAAGWCDRNPQAIRPMGRDRLIPTLVVEVEAAIEELGLTNVVELMEAIPYLTNEFVDRNACNSLRRLLNRSGDGERHLVRVPEYGGWDGKKAATVKQSGRASDSPCVQPAPYVRPTTPEDRPIRPEEMAELMDSIDSEPEPAPQPEPAPVEPETSQEESPVLDPEEECKGRDRQSKGRIRWRPRRQFRSP